MSAHQVVWPYATVRVVDPATGQPTVRGFAEGAILPPNAVAEDVQRLAGKGAVVALDVAEPAPDAQPDPEPDPDPAPTGGRPKDYASKPEWVEYAVTRRPEGVSEDEARQLAELTSKADLIAEYGS